MVHWMPIDQGGPICTESPAPQRLNDTTLERYESQCFAYIYWFNLI
jgi:hypothetical protein